MTFDDVQSVQSLRKHLLRTMVVLDAQLQVAKGCKLHCGTLNSSALGPKKTDLLSELGAYSAQLKTHRGIVAAMLERSQGTLDLVSFHLL